MRKEFRKILIEITNICNLRCSFCYGTKRAPGYMDADTFALAAEQAAPLAGIISPHLLGEPLTHPNFRQILKISEEKGLSLNIVTNGTLLERHIDFLASCGCLKQITVSLHAMRQLGSEERKNHMDKFMRFAEIISGSGKIFAFRLRGDNSDPFVSGTCAGIAARFGVKKDIKQNKSTPLGQGVYLNRGKIFSWRTTEERTAPCRGLRHHFGILCDGRVVPCCAACDGQITLGNIRENSLDAIIHSAETEALKKALDDARTLPDYCRHCGFSAP